MITSLDQLTPAARAAALAWIESQAAAVDAELRADLRDELTIALCETLEPTSTPADVDDLARAFGPLGPEAEAAEAGDDPRVGTWHGIPYDWRPPTGERILHRLWDPANPDLFVPRAFGAGWDLNVGALAVRLHLIEPDAEDEPFAATPHDAFTAAAVPPVLLAAAVVAHYAARGRNLPPEMASHWTLAGRPDGHVTRARAAATDLAAAVGAATLGVLAAASRTNGAGRAGRLAVAAGMASLAATFTVARTLPRGAWWVGPATVASGVAAPGATLLGLAYAGRGSERRRDLGPR